MDGLIYFIFLALLAEILGTIGGFGSSLFFVPIASYFLDFHSVLGITALFHITSNATKIIFFRNGFDKKCILFIGIPAIVFVIVGAYISQFIKTNLLELLLAVFLVTISLIFLLFNTITIKPTRLNSISGGIFSGVIAGLLGTGGAIRGVALAAFNLKTDVFIATSAIIDLGIDTSRGVVYFLNGYMHKEDLYLIPILALVSVAGTFLGKKLLKNFSEKQFKSIVFILILITGISTLVKLVYKNYI